MEAVNVQNSASTPNAQAGAGNLLKFLSFSVNGTEYAFDALRVKEIIEYASITRIPMVPNYIRGVTNLRGSVVPVIDLAARFGKPSAPVTRRTSIIMVEVNGDGEKTILGVVIDSINEVFNIEQNQIEPTPNFGAGIPAKFIGGMGKVADRFVILMNTDQVLSVSDLARLEGEITTEEERDAALPGEQVETNTANAPTKQ